jgi:molybdopterin converting factor subunit 1
MDGSPGVSLAGGTGEMVVRIRLFAILRERAGRDAVELRLSSGATVADALKALSDLEPLGELLARLPIQMAVNRDYATAETTLGPGDELALIPPVSGGGEEGDSGAADAELLHVRVSGEPLSVERLSRAVERPSAGAIVIFQGVTREVQRLEYEAYAEMAEERIGQIMRECIAEHSLCAAAVEHRVGSVALGEPSVIVAVSAPHREEAFAGARAAIDRIKAQAPIWKREHASDGQGVWVPGVAPAAGDGKGASTGGARP